MIDYLSFTIRPVTWHQPFYRNGRFIKYGYVVSRENVNPMPGATWFYTIEEAKDAIDVLIAVGADYIAFWRRIHAMYDAREAFGVTREELEIVYA